MEYYECATATEHRIPKAVKSDRWIVEARNVQFMLVRSAIIKVKSHYNYFFFMTNMKIVHTSKAQKSIYFGRLP